ncbi:MAG TPA: hypothetical protein VM597_25350 [Gemmataceae bacterium]|nr:hypothetical protein [Gemmataceae bacterium]
MTRVSLCAAWAALAVVLVVGVPLVYRTPVWVDVTYHDVSAWNVLHGGTHYRDVFETNLPGMVWAHCLIRSQLGYGHEAIRAVDLVVVLWTCLFLARLLNRAGLARSGRVWFLTAAALFYLFETEFIHCQRDTWMLSLAVIATNLRLSPSPRRSVRVAEGLLWGAAVWIKPHVLVPALCVWLVSLRFTPPPTRWREAAGLLAGGLIAGAAGAAWLVWSGTWGPMWDVLLNWNGEYYRWSWEHLWIKIKIVPAYFPPFSLLHVVAMPVAIFALFRGGLERAVLAALYLGWLAQATVIQKEFDYAHAPAIFLGLAVLAVYRWPVGPVFLAWCVAGGLSHELADRPGWLSRLQDRYPRATRMGVPAHPSVRSDRLGLWPRCWDDNSWELKDRLTYYRDIHCAPDWADLDRVASFLQDRGVGDGDLICWHDATHPLYVMLGVRPGFRFPHVLTAMKFRSKLPTIRAEAFASRARFVVSDLVPVTYTASFYPAPPPGPVDTLPREFPAWGKDVYPWNQPVVFRAGRYFVHEVREPRGEIEFPFPEEMKE